MDGAYNLSFAVLLLTGSGLGDRLGRRLMFVCGIVVFTAASVGCALAGDVGWLIAARAVQGAGAALIMPLAMALLSAAFDRAERAKALGLFGGVTGLALIAGPVVGGAIAQGFAWRWIFWVNVPIAAVALPLATRRMAESFGTKAPIDGKGLVLVTASALGLVWGLMRANSAGWTSIEVTGALGAGVLLAVLFVWWELNTDAPMVPMRLFGSNAFASGTASAFLFYGAMYGVLFLLPQYLQTAQGHGPLGAGLRLLPWTSTLFVFAPIGGTLVKRYGERRLVVGGLLAQALGMAWIGVIAAPGFPYEHLVVPLLLAGAGVSLAMPAAQNAVIGAVASAEIGKASGTFNMLRYLGGAFGIAVLVATFAHPGDLASAKGFSDGFARAMLGAAALSLLGAFAGLALPTRALPAASRVEGSNDAA
jgi:EmrB/QacA subfamily drug resistance transporter